MSTLVLLYPPCSTCQKAKQWLAEKQLTYEERNIVTDNPSVTELTAWWQISGLPLKKFFNTSGLLYKTQGLKAKLPLLTEEEQLALLATNGMLIKRPLVVSGEVVLLGFKPDTWEILVPNNK
ncbi:MAG: arsenate reductase family protein [Acidaminococcaceae bacterium]